MILRPGDVLLYKGQGVFSRIIALKTWHQVSHVECYVGNGKSVASRNGLGTATYPLRLNDLVMVCRPLAFNVEKAMRWFASQPHQPYGWADLLQFAGMNIDTKGIVCSPFITEFLRAGDLDPFNGEPASKIAPFQFELSPCFVNIPYPRDAA